jgi:hypothetical protein
LWELVKPFTVWIATRQDWQKPDKITDPNVNLWFTDWSQINDCFGAGFYGPLCNYRESIPMGSHSTMLSAEVMAILRCTEILLTKNLMRREYTSALILGQL